MRVSNLLLAIVWAAFALLLWAPLLGLMAGTLAAWAAGDVPIGRVDVGPNDLLRLAGMGALALGTTVAAALAARRLGDERLQDLAQSNLAAAMTHELRTPIATIRMYAEMLREDLVTDPATRRRFLSGIEAACGRLDGLVEDVLTFAALSEGRLDLARAPVAVAELVEEAAAAAAGELTAAGLALETEVPDGLLVFGDRRQLARVLANLLGNAAKYAAAGGRVRVEARAQGTSVAISVRDWGPGIPAAERKRVWKPFYRGGDERTRERPGTGLGLALVRHLAEAHGGRALVDAPADGPGARVTLTLPAG